MNVQSQKKQQVGTIPPLWQLDIETVQILFRGSTIKNPSATQLLLMLQWMAIVAKKEIKEPLKIFEGGINEQSKKLEHFFAETFLGEPSGDLETTIRHERTRGTHPIQMVATKKDGPTASHNHSQTHLTCIKVESETLGVMAAITMDCHNDARQIMWTGMDRITNDSLRRSHAELFYALLTAL